MTTPLALRATALAALLATAGGLHAQEATAWEMQGPAASPAAAMTTRQDVMSRMALARAEGWRGDGEVSRFSDERSADLRRMARSVHTRSAVVAEARQARRIGLLDGDAGEAGPGEETLAKREAFNELSRQTAMAQWQQERQAQTLAAVPAPATPGAPTMRMSESPGVREWWGTAGSGTGDASADAGRNSSDTPTEPGQDRPQSPLAPARETALTAPTRPENPLAEGPAREGSRDGTAAEPQQALGQVPSAAPLAAAAASEPARSAVSATPSGIGAVEAVEPAQGSHDAVQPSALPPADAAAPEPMTTPSNVGPLGTVPPVQPEPLAQPASPLQEPAAAMPPPVLQEPAAAMPQPVLPQEPAMAVPQPVAPQPVAPQPVVPQPLAPQSQYMAPQSMAPQSVPAQEPAGAVSLPVAPQDPAAALPQPVAPQQPLQAVDLAPSTPAQ